MAIPNIIAGKYRGKKIHVLESNGLRPTSSRIRETLFNWLQHDIHAINTLDLFAGSGLLSFEALSRGAQASTLIEKDTRVYKALKKNAAFMTEEEINIHNMDALLFLKKNTLEKYQLIFIDPPFGSTLYPKIFAALEEKLIPGTLIYLESPELIEKLPFPSSCLKQKKAGQVYYALFETSNV